MLIEFIKQHAQFLPGTVRELGGGIADVLIRRGLARPVPVAAPPPAPPPEPPPEPPPPTPPPALPPAAKKKGK